MEAIVLIELIVINQSSYADGLRVHTTRPSPNSHAILAALDHAGAAARRPASATATGACPSAPVTTGRRQIGTRPATEATCRCTPRGTRARTPAASARRPPPPRVRSTPPLRRARTGTPRTPAPPALPPRRTPRPADRAASSSSEQESPQRRRPHQRPSRRP